MKLKYFKIFLFFLCISCGYTNKEISQNNENDKTNIKTMAK